MEGRQQLNGAGRYNVWEATSNSIEQNAIMHGKPPFTYWRLWIVLAQTMIRLLHPGEFAFLGDLHSRCNEAIAIVRPVTVAFEAFGVTAFRHQPIWSKHHCKERVQQQTLTLNRNTDLQIQNVLLMYLSSSPNSRMKLWCLFDRVFTSQCFTCS